MKANVGQVSRSLREMINHYLKDGNEGNYKGCISDHDPVWGVIMHDYK